jgi:polyhydroxyalkanoate synthesis regulator phasin
MMAKKAKQESQEDQSERFGRLVQDLVDAGELNPTEAQERFEQAMQKLAPPRC